MNTLAFDLATSRGSLCVTADETVLLECEWPNDRQNSSQFFTTLKAAAAEFALELIVVGLGPGSYAGTRIAISAAVGLRLAANAKLVGYPSICALPEPDCCVVGDARRNSFYFARVQGRTFVSPPRLVAAEELGVLIAQADLPVYTTESLPLFSEPKLAFPRAPLLAAMGAAQAVGASSEPLEPIYLREPHITTPRG